MTVHTLSALFRHVVAHDRADCLLEKRDGAYRPIPAHELTARVRGLAATLDGWGVRPGDRVALMAENGPHWAA
ncbi:MAG: long-chain fatty acid--CoA ligase, partial [Thermoanaerobaculia bacterium]|nr:long-chain fatty acid--CoA ligase [Thermoanaerobaculia bacterium]